MHINKIDHICIAVRDLDKAREPWEKIIGKGPDDEYVDEPEQIRVARYWLGGVGFELMESTSPDGQVAKHIERRGEGVMIISFNVDSTAEAVDELAQEGFPFIPVPGSDKKLRPFRDCEFAFMHPRSVNNVLLELIDYKWDELK